MLKGSIMDAEKAMERISMLMQRTQARGASESEEAAAAAMIGRLIMQFPCLLDDFEAPEPEPPPVQSFGRGRRHDVVRFTIQGIEHETMKAVLVMIRYKEYWVPRSQIIDLSPTSITMSGWMAKELKLV